MGSIPLDNGESVYIHDGTGSADPVAISAAEGSSVAALMANRERFDYTWANSAERVAQTGMVQGSRGYQEDTKTEYLYDSSAWRLATPYIEFSGGNQVIPDTGEHGLTGWSVDGTRSSDTTMVTNSLHGFTFVRPGIYIIQMRVAGGSGGGLTMLTAETPPVEAIEVSGYVGAVASWSTPYRITAANTILYVWHAGQAVTVSGRRLRIARLG